MTLLTELQGLLLNDWDPIGVADEPDAIDEYDDYVEHLHNMLIAGTTIDDIAAYLGKIITDDMQMPADEARDRSIAERAMAIYSRPPSG